MTDELRKETENLAANVEACRKTLIAIGDETRQHIIIEMIRMDPGGVRVPELTARTNLSRPAVSHHLGILRDAGIVKMRKEGRMNWYYLDPDMRSFKSLISVLERSVSYASELPYRGEE